MMKGRKQFTKVEAERIRALLNEKNLHVGKDWQKPIRDKLRRMGFYISDFEGMNFTSEDFDTLVRSGRIKIV